MAQTFITQANGFAFSDEKASLILADTFNAKDVIGEGEYVRQYQRYGTSRAIAVTDLTGNVLSHVDYTIEYTISSGVATDDLIDEDAQWRTGNLTFGHWQSGLSSSRQAWQKATINGWGYWK